MFALQVPRTCDMATVEGQSNDCGQDPFVVLPNRSKYVDQQQLKLQVELHVILGGRVGMSFADMQGAGVPQDMELILL